MPYTIRKKYKRNCYTIYNTKTRRVFSKCTSMKKAKKQLRLLTFIENPKNKKLLRRTMKKHK